MSTSRWLNTKFCDASGGPRQAVRFVHCGAEWPRPAEGVYVAVDVRDQPALSKL